MKLTTEQQGIIDCKIDKDSLALIKAFAGTGKTTTLVEFAKARQASKMLYLSFNKSVQIEASAKFPKNVLCKTAHSLAWPGYGSIYKNRLIPSLKANAVMEALDLDAYEVARFTIDTLNRFLYSADRELTDKHVPAIVKYSQFSGHDYVSYATDLGRLMCNGGDKKIGVTHDLYLKQYASNQPQLDFDYILVDEAQDLSEVQASIFLGQRNVPLILVGDDHQSIYQFRGAKNMMSMVKPTHLYYLTKSFRFNNHIATVANILLKAFKQETQTIEGLNPNQPDQSAKARTFIARTNAAIFKKAAQLYETKTLGFVGGINGYRFERIIDVFNLYASNYDRIQDPYIRSFDSYEAMRKYAKTVEDFELSSMAGVVDEFKSLIPVLVPKIKSATVEDLSMCDVILTTAHKSKGLEFDSCKLLDDFAMLVKDNEIIDPENLEEAEINLIYVACTRAMRNLILSRNSSVAQFINLYQKSRPGQQCYSV
jgi:F-box protein 18 (helicase)